MKRRMLLLLLLPAGCARPPQGELEAALAHYADALRRQDAVAVADCFLPEGSMGHEGQATVTGPAAIRALLESFAAYRVTAYRIAAETTRVTGGVAFQGGRWAQTVRTPEGQLLEVQGRFDLEWRLDTGGRWRIARLRTAN